MNGILLKANKFISQISGKRNSSFSNFIFGKWELSCYYGKFINPFNSALQRGNGYLYLFKNDYTYEHYSQGNLDECGNFYIREYSKNGKKGNFLYFENIDLELGFQISENKLSISYQIGKDEGKVEYQKVQN